MEERDNPNHATRTTRHVIIAVFTQRSQAEAARDQLYTIGFTAQQVAIDTKDSRASQPTAEQHLRNPAPQTPYTAQLDAGSTLLQVSAFDETQAQQAQTLLTAHGGSIHTYAAGSPSHRNTPLIPADYLPDGDNPHGGEYRGDPSQIRPHDDELSPPRGQLLCNLAGGCNDTHQNCNFLPALFY